MRLNPKIIDFFKKHNLYDPEMFNYFEEHSTMIDSAYKEERIATGCAYLINRNTGVLEGLHLNLPYVKDEETILDSIHELTHAIFTYPKIGKKFKRDITIETLPLLYEKLYLMEHQSKELQDYAHRLDGLIDETNPEYAFGLDAREKLFNEYHYNPEEMAKKVSKMGQKYQFEQFKNKFHRK